MRSDAEIKNEIALLKDMQPFIFNTGMAPDNTDKIAAQIEVLEQRLNESQIERRFYHDETAEEFEQGDNDVWSDALAAHNWMHGDDDMPPSHKDNWGGVAHSNGWIPKPHTTGGKRT